MIISTSFLLYTKSFLKGLSLKERFPCKGPIPHDALLTGTKSPWHKLYQCHDDQAMKTFTGFDARCLDYVLEKYANMLDALTTFFDGKVT